jgi:putative ABC transport system ATP-binding protein
MLKLQNITKQFRTTEVETTALNNINLEIERGEFVAIMGPSGCGKSTLLNVIGMLDQPTSGAYFFDNVDIAGYTESQLADTRKQHLGFIFQSFNLIDELSVAENIGLSLLYRDVSTSERKRRVEALMEQLGIAPRANHFPPQLSGGQQQRVAIARALVAEPSVILADEPTGNLDTAHGDEVLAMLHAINDDGATVVMVTHSPAHAEHAGRVIQLLDGRLVSN